MHFLAPTATYPVFPSDVDIDLALVRIRPKYANAGSTQMPNAILLQTIHDTIP